MRCLCDVNCVLQGWSQWGKCTKACNGGINQSYSAIAEEKKGKGTCPAADSTDRYMTKVCNTQACIGDETCIAEQDIIIAIDGSGSIGKDGYEILKKFASKLLQRFQGWKYELPKFIGNIFFFSGRKL